MVTFDMTFESHDGDTHDCVEIGCSVRHNGRLDTIDYVKLVAIERLFVFHVNGETDVEVLTFLPANDEDALLAGEAIRQVYEREIEEFVNQELDDRLNPELAEPEIGA